MCTSVDCTTAKNLASKFPVLMEITTRHCWGHFLRQIVSITLVAHYGFIATVVTAGMHPVMAAT